MSSIRDVEPGDIVQVRGRVEGRNVAGTLVVTLLDEPNQRRVSVDDWTFIREGTVHDQHSVGQDSKTFTLQIPIVDGVELPTLLAFVARHSDLSPHSDGTGSARIRDSKGNTVGSWEIA